jgi:hypothetical protein
VETAVGEILADRAIRHLIDPGRADFAMLANRSFRAVKNIFHKGIKMRGILFDLWLVQASSRQACETTVGSFAQAKNVGQNCLCGFGNRVWLFTIIARTIETTFETARAMKAETLTLCFGDEPTSASVIF